MFKYGSVVVNYCYILYGLFIKYTTKRLFTAVILATIRASHRGISLFFRIFQFLYTNISKNAIEIRSLTFLDFHR